MIPVPLTTTPLFLGMKRLAVEAICRAVPTRDTPDGSSAALLLSPCHYPLFNAGTTEALFGPDGALVGLMVKGAVTDPAHAALLAYTTAAGACWMAFAEPPKQQGLGLIFACDAPGLAITSGVERRGNIFNITVIVAKPGAL